jgi:hypothetical protein
MTMCVIEGVEMSTNTTTNTTTTTTTTTTTGGRGALPSRRGSSGCRQARATTVPCRVPSQGLSWLVVAFHLQQQQQQQQQHQHQHQSTDQFLVAAQGSLRWAKPLSDIGVGYSLSRRHGGSEVGSTSYHKPQQRQDWRLKIAGTGSYCSCWSSSRQDRSFPNAGSTWSRKQSRMG